MGGGGVENELLLDSVQPVQNQEQPAACWCEALTGQSAVISRTPLKMLALHHPEIGA
jgi:hypothetical protein